MSNDKQAGTAPLDALIKECRLEQKVEKHSAAMRGMTLEQAEQYVGAELVLAPSQSVPLQVPRWQDRTHEMDGPHKRLELACQEIEQLRTALAHALPPDQGLSQPGRWNVLSDDDKPDASRLLDVILSNGVCLMDRQHSKIDWSAVRDWRYSAAPAQADEARDAARWSKEPPTEQADYWHWDGDEDHAPMIYHVLWSGTAKKCFVSIGQYGIDEAIWCDNFGGYWMKIEQPSTRTNTTGGK